MRPTRLAGFLGALGRLRAKQIDPYHLGQLRDRRAGLTIAERCEQAEELSMLAAEDALDAAELAVLLTASREDYIMGDRAVNADWSLQAHHEEEGGRFAQLRLHHRGERFEGRRSSLRDLGAWLRTGEPTPEMLRAEAVLPGSIAQCEAIREELLAGYFAAGLNPEETEG